MNSVLNPLEIKEARKGEGVRRPGDLVDFAGLFELLWRIRGRLFGAVILGGLIGLLFGIFVKTPQYQSVASIVLSAMDEEMPALNEIMPGLKTGASYVNTQAEILRSPSLINRVARDLSLLEDAEFNADLRPIGPFAEATNALLGYLAPYLPPWVLQGDGAETRVNAALMRRINVRNFPDSLVFEIYVQTGDAQKSARIANRLAEIYILSQIETKFAATEQATAWLNERVASLKSDLQRAEARVQGFTTEIELVSAESLAALTRQLKDIRDRHAALSMDEQGMASGLARTRAKAQVEALENAALALEARINRQSEDLVTLEELQREVEANRLIYEFFLARLKETAVQRGVHKADARLLSKAVPSQRPIRPNLPVITAFCALVALVLVAGSRLISAARNPVFETPEDLQRLTGQTVLGQTPSIRARRRQDVLQLLKNKPDAPLAEAIRNLRTSLLWGRGRQVPKVILSTSSLPGEGKTTHSLALAQNLSDLGHRVLVVECDLRKPVFAEVLGPTNRPGLSGLASEKLTLEGLVTQPKGFGYAAILAGKGNGNAADLFTSRVFSELIEAAKKEYDHVILDAPPVLVVPDARILGQLADTILYSVKALSTTTRETLRGLDMLQSVGLGQIGLVFSQVRQQETGYYAYAA